MAAQSGNTMFNYFTKLTSKTCIVEETNPRKLAPAFNKQHVENFQKDRLEKFDAELYRLNNLDAQTENIPTNQETDNVSMQLETETPEQRTLLNYIESIKCGQYKPFRLERKLRGPLRSRLLQYHEDVRPPYFGTWQKRSKKVVGRRPFATDESVFDYEVDSEAEWDIGGPGESLKGDDSEDEEELDDYEIDMKTFVPHGYVSDDEIEAHSDQEDNGSPSGNQSVENVEYFDLEEESNASVKIIAEKRVKLTTITNPKQQCNFSSSNNVNNQANGNFKKVSLTQVESPQQATAIAQPTRQPKLDVKPIILGIYYENQRPSIISESKIHFLRGFQGYLCN